MKFRSVFAALLALIAAISGRAQQTNNNSTTRTNAAPAQPGFRVTGYHLDGNTVLPPEKTAFLTNFTGPSVTFSRLREGLGQLQLLYRSLGFATISVTLPQQKLTNGIVEVKVIEGKLEAINVVSNRFFTSNNVMRAVPSLKTNVLINTKWLQPELDRANLNPDRQIYPIVSPGRTPGYTDLTLGVKDRLPLHGHFEINDKSTPETPLLRIDSAMQYNNLWQLNHQAGFEYNFSPQEVKADNARPGFIDAPRVDSYSAFYRMPFSEGAPLREEYERLPVDFGYNQITHRFNLPPASGSPELIVYASRSSSETRLQYGPLKTIVSSPLATITSQSAEQDLTVTENAGAKFNLPLKEFVGIRSALSFGIDYKDFRQNALSTNLSYFTTPITNNGVASTTNSTVALPNNSHQRLSYAPLSFGWSGDRQDKHGAWSFNITENLFLSPLASSRTNFQSVAGSSAAGRHLHERFAFRNARGIAAARVVVAPERRRALGVRTTYQQRTISSRRHRRGARIRGRRELQRRRLARDAGFAHAAHQHRDVPACQKSGPRVRPPLRIPGLRRRISA
jgi:hypothetical protein